MTNSRYGFRTDMVSIVTYSLPFNSQVVERSFASLLGSHQQERSPRQPDAWSNINSWSTTSFLKKQWFYSSPSSTSDTTSKCSFDMRPCHFATTSITYLLDYSCGVLQHSEPAVWHLRKLRSEGLFLEFLWNM